MKWKETIPIHNSPAEQQMNRVALGRKNYLFVGNERGGPTPATLSSSQARANRARRLGIGMR